MKIRTAKHVIKEGAINTYRNKLMTLASVTTVTASLLVFGVFLLVAINLKFNLQILTSQPEMEVFCRPDLKAEEIEGLKDNIKANDKIEKYTFVSKDEAFARAKKIMGENADILDGEDSSFLGVSFIIKLKNSADTEAIAQEYKKMPEVDDVTYYIEQLNFIQKITKWVDVIGVVLLVVLLVISTFIISNTIKLTVFARRKEINIMKFIGATDWFIRWPFIIEGIIIGILGAAVAFILLGYGYNSIESKFNHDLISIGSDTVRMLKINEFGLKVVLAYIFIGTFVGVSGSALSMRKYLKV